MSVSPKRFRVAFSFAGEKRDFVSKVAAILADKFGEDRILYDKYHEAEFARHNLGIYLPKLYGEQSDLIVPVVCPNYDPKRWTGWEWLHIYGLLTKDDGHRVMPSRFEHAEVEGLTSASAFIELDHKTPEAFAALIFQRLALNDGKPREFYLKKTKTDPFEAFSMVSVTKYLSAVHQRFSIHNAIGIGAVEDPKQKQGPDRIEDLFVPPTCTTKRVSPENMEVALKDGKNSALPLLAHLEKERRVVLLADPGMGKSTLVQWLVVAFSSPVAHASVQGFGRTLPLPFILRDLLPLMPTDLTEWSWQKVLQAFLTHRQDEHSPAMAQALAADEDAWRAVLASSQTWFLLDGLDEIGDPAKRIAMRNAIWQGFEAHSGARFLITSRIVGYDSARVHDRELARNDELLGSSESEQAVRFHFFENNLIGITEENADTNDNFEWAKGVVKSGTLILPLAECLYLAPWDDAQQQSFAQHWFRLRLGESDGSVRAREFIQAVRRHPSTGAIGRVPNLLLLMALLYRFRANLPHGRASVYAAISQAYLENIPAARRIQHRTVPYGLAEKERLLAIVAMHLQLRRDAESHRKGRRPKAEPELLATRTDLETWLCPEFGGKSDEDAHKAMDAFIDHIAESSGLLLPRGQDLFGFAHLSFQEYYAAYWLDLEFDRLRDGDDDSEENALRFSRERFTRIAAQDVWREALLFLAELQDKATAVRRLCQFLFGDYLAKLDLLKLEAAKLLATFSVDQQVKLQPEDRTAIWSSLWQRWIQLHPDKYFTTHPWHVAPALLEGAEESGQVLDGLCLLLVELKGTCLDLSGCIGISDLSKLPKLDQLQTLYLNGCTGISDLSKLPKLDQLLTLYLSGCTGISDLSPLTKLDQLQILVLSDCTGISDLSTLPKLDQLSVLDLSGCTGISNLSPLAKLQWLQSLSLSDCTGISDLSRFPKLDKLVGLYIRGCTGLSDLRTFSQFEKLEHLDLGDCTGINDLGTFPNLKNLQALSLCGCTGISDLSKLPKLEKLQFLYLTGCTCITETQVEAFKQKHPKCGVAWP